MVAKVDGTAVENMTLTASGELHDSSLFGGTIPQLTFESSIANNDLHVKASGQLEKINPAIALGKPPDDSNIAGSITGSIDAVELTMKHLSQGTDINSVAAYVLADFGPSTVGKYSIDKAYVQADYPTPSPTHCIGRAVRRRRARQWHHR